MDFQQAEEKFRELKARFKAGEIDEAEYKARLEDLMVEDAQGDWWMIGYNSEHWHRHDGTDWVRDDPPGYVLPANAPMGLPPKRETGEGSTPKPAAPPARKPVGTWIWLGVGALAVIGLFVLSPIFSGPTPTPSPLPAYYTQWAAETATAESSGTLTEAAIAPTTVPAADAPILFQDDFSNTSSGWLSIDDPTRIADYTGEERYQILNFADHQDTWSHPGLDLSDVSIEVDATKESGQDDNDFGVICRYQNDQNFYFFVISSDGRQLIGKFQDNEFMEISPGGMQRADAIKQGNSTNHLRADCTGSTLTFYINGERVASVTDDTFTSGDVGLMAGTNSAPTVEVAFDNFVVRKADASAQASPAADASILFQDDFSDPNSGWFLVTDWGGSAIATYTSSGQYRLDAKVPHVEVLARPGKHFTDTRMEVDVTVDWAHEGKYGLICRYQDEFNFYVFMVDNNWFFIGRRDGNSNKVLVDWTRTSAIVSYIDGTYHLRADCSGSTLTFFINGEEQASVTDDSLRDGDVGLLLLAPDEPNAERIFDNFVVHKPEGGSSSAAPESPTEAPAFEFGQPIGEPLTGHSNVVLSVDFSPDGKILASGSGDHTIRLWDVASRKQIGQPLTGHTFWVDSVAFSPDGRILASGSWDKTIRLWDVASGQPIGDPLTGHTGSVVSVAFSPDGSTLASGGGEGDPTIRLWDVAGRQQIGEPLSGHTDLVRSVAFSPDGKILASGSEDHTIRLWDVASRRLIGEPLTGQNYTLVSVAFSPDGKILASGGWDRAIFLWDVESGQSIGEPLKGLGPVESVTFSPDGKILASGGWDQVILLFDVASGQPIGEPFAGHNGFVRSVAFSPDGMILASGGDDYTIRLWDVARR